jgi:drug/metabolite transporter (DMT)-like permease
MILIATFLFASMDASVKYVTFTLPLVLVLWVRYAVQAAAMVAWIWPKRGRAGFRVAHPRFQIARGVLLVLVSGLAFVAVSHMPLAEFTAILMLWPVLATVVAARMFRERVGRLRWMLVAGGFVGTLIVIRPGFGLFGWEALLPVVTMVVAAAYNLLTSRLAVLDDPHATQFHTGAVGTLLLAPLLLFYQPGDTLTAIRAAPALDLWLTLFIGTCGAIGHLLIVMAFSRAGTATLLPFTYSQIAFAALVGWFVFRSAPDFWAWIGMSIIAICGAAAAWLNVRQAQRAGAPPAALEPAAD